MQQSYYLFSSGNLKRKDNSLTLEKSDGTRSDIPIERIKDLYIFSSMTYNNELFSFLGSKGIIIHMFNYYEFYIGSFYPREISVCGNLLVNQVLHYLDDEKRLYLAKEFVLTATDNIYRNLRYYKERGKNVDSQMDKISSIKNQVMISKSIKEIMGNEGVIHQIYYSTFNEIVEQNINFEKRVKRPPDNMINTLISYCNTLVYTKVLSQIYYTQLNPTISYLHEPGTKRFSLCLDLAEVFKPLIADRMIFSLLNHKQITEDDFDQTIGYLRIKEKGVKTIVSEFDKRMGTTVMHRTSKSNVSYEHLIKIECYKLIKHIMGIKQYTGFRIWW